MQMPPRFLGVGLELGGRRAGFGKDWDYAGNLRHGVRVSTSRSRLV